MTAGPRFGVARLALTMLVSLAWLAAGRAAAQDTTAPGPASNLLPGVETTGVLVAGRSIAFGIVLDADQAVQLQVTQPDANLRLWLTDPAGQEVVRANLRSPQQGPEQLRAVAASAGVYQLHIAVASGPADADAHFAVTVASVDAADANQVAFVQALQAYARADTTAAAGSAEARRAGLALFEQARAGWHTAGARFEEATALNRIGLTHMNLSSLPQAITAFEQSLQLRRDTGDRYGEGVALNNLAATYTRLGNYDRAGSLYDESVQVRREVGDRGGEAWSLLGVATARSVRSTDWTAILALYQEALDIFLHEKDQAGMAEAHYSIGRTQARLGHFDEAVDAFHHALTRRQQQKDIAGQASTLNQLGSVHLQLGDPERALELFDDALRLRRQAGDRRGEAYTLQSTGVAQTTLGHYAAALERLEEARRLFDAVSDREGQTSALTHLAHLALITGEPQRSLTLAQRALAIVDQRPNLITTFLLSVTGDAQLAMKRYDEAAGLYQRAVLSAREMGDALAEARSLAGLGRVASARLAYAESRGHLLAALDLIESARATVATSELRATFLGASQAVYDSTIDTLLELHRQDPSARYAAEALAVSERRRARSLLETLAEARANLRDGVATSLLEREDALQRDLRAQSAARLSATPTTTPETDARERAIGELVEQLRDVRATIRASSPRYAALNNPSPLDLAGIQRLLDPQTILLEYFIGERRSTLWAITATEMSMHDLPPRSELETAALQARDLITKSTQRSVRGPLRLALSALSAMLLGPVARMLRDRRLAIVADGALQYVPFAALPRPGATGAAQDEPLMLRHEIVMLPSASTLAVLRDGAGDRPAATRTVAVLADPITEPTDPRVSRVELPMRTGEADDGGGGMAARDLARATSALGVTGFTRLPYSRDEALAIESAAGGSSALTALGFDATRELTLSPALRDFNVVHFATHAVLDARHPELSGIVLSLLDRQGLAVDGFVRLHDIYTLKLSAQVVVLSACETALGQDIRGEGLIGLTRGFMHAGASQVVASLWNVRDQATAVLMREFYAGLLRRGLTPAAALRAAQIALWRNPRWRMPAYWAGFIAQGDWHASNAR